MVRSYRQQPAAPVALPRSANAMNSGIAESRLSGVATIGSSQLGDLMVWEARQLEVFWNRVILTAVVVPVQDGS